MSNHPDRLTAAFSQVKKDVRMLTNPKTYEHLTQNQIISGLTVMLLVVGIATGVYLGGQNQENRPLAAAPPYGTCTPNTERCYDGNVWKCPDSTKVWEPGVGTCSCTSANDCPDARPFCRADGVCSATAACVPDFCFTGSVGGAQCPPGMNIITDTSCPASLKCVCGVPQPTTPPGTPTPRPCAGTPSESCTDSASACSANGGSVIGSATCGSVGVCCSFPLTCVAPAQCVDNSVSCNANGGHLTGDNCTIPQQGLCCIFPSATPIPTSPPGSTAVPTQPPVNTPVPTNTPGPTAPPGSTNTPVPTATNTPVIGPVCLNVTVNDPGATGTVPMPGDVITLTCAANTQIANVDRFEFQLTTPTGVVVLNSSNADKSISESYQIPVNGGGTYTAKCQACNGTTCSGWE